MLKDTQRYVFIGFDRDGDEHWYGRLRGVSESDINFFELDYAHHYVYFEVWMLEEGFSDEKIEMIYSSLEK